MDKRIITDPGSYPIRPQHIDTDKHFWEAFGNVEKEEAANFIVVFCQRSFGGRWTPFPMEAINSFSRDIRGKDFYFSGLDSDGYFVLVDGLYKITHEFVAACFKSSPGVPGLTE